jgi:hypothetical protein
MAATPGKVKGLFRDLPAGGYRGQRTVLPG